MKKINIVKTNRDFNRIISKNKPYKYKDYIIYVERNNDSIYKFGITISKKIINAVGRNKIKRQIKNIIDQKNYQNGFNCIIIVRRGILNKKYNEMSNDLLECLSKINIIKGDKDEKQNI